MSEPSPPDVDETDAQSEGGPEAVAPPPGSGEGSDEESAEPVDGAAEEEEEIPYELQQEVAIGGTEAGIATNNALRSLSRAARSFLLYEPRNQAIRDFLADFRETMGSALTSHGKMVLDIRPFEMVREGEVVYLERERERSMSFRLFRDGVRRITIEPDVVWDELLRLLEILSIRYSGVRSLEDDIVTLLWKAGFKSISIVAVEGFVPEEELPTGGWSSELPQNIARKRRRKRKGMAHVEAPPDWDLPLAPFDTVGTIAYRKIPEARLEELRAEMGSRNMPSLSVRLVARLLDVVKDKADPAELDDVLPLVNEVRGFLLSEGQLDSLVQLLREVELRHDIDPDAMDEVMARFADTAALQSIIHSVGKAVERVPPELLELLEMIPQDHLEHLMDLLVKERGAASRRITRMLIEKFIAEAWDPAFVYERMHRETSGVMVDILRACGRALPERTLTEAESLATHDASEVQLELLWLLDRSDDEATVAATMLKMLLSRFEEVRIRVLTHLETYGEETQFSALKAYVEQFSTRKMSNRECEGAGRVMANINPGEAEKVFSDWIKPPGFFKRMVEMPGAQSLQWVAVTGMGDIQGEKPSELIRWLSERCGEELYKHCMMTLVKRRKGGTASG